MQDGDGADEAPFAGAWQPFVFFFPSISFPLFIHYTLRGKAGGYGRVGRGTKKRVPRAQGSTEAEGTRGSPVAKAGTGYDPGPARASAGTGGRRTGGSKLLD